MGGEKPSKNLVRPFSPSENVFPPPKMCSHLSVHLPLPLLHLEGSVPRIKVTFQSQHEAYVAHSLLVRTWPRGSTTSQLLGMQEAMATRPWLSPASGRGHCLLVPEGN